MKKRLFIYSILIIFAGLSCFLAASVYLTYLNNLSIAKDTVSETAHICAELYDDGMDLGKFAGVGGYTRITVISSDGTVLADSLPLNVATIENHLGRPEIQAAANDAPAAFKRYSDTLGVDFIYYALKAESGDGYVFIRTSMPIGRIDAYLYQSLPLFVIIFVVLALICFILIRSMVNRVVKPFSYIERKLRRLTDGGNMPSPAGRNYEEIDAITREIDDMAQVLHDSLGALNDEKTKAEYILNNIADGIFAVDPNEDIVMINNAALSIFDVTPDISGKNLAYLSYDSTLISAVKDSLTVEKDALMEFTLNARTYLVVIKRLPGTMLTMVILSDVTESRDSAKQREEFFSNASHELKTPLTAIKGFNELTALNNKDESIAKYIAGIARETERMLLLIGDMLMLSELESTQEINAVHVELAPIVSDVRDTLSTAITEKSLTFSITGDAVIEAEPGHVYDLVKNLAENSVRYTNRGGRVSVNIESAAGNTFLCISDNGIGISHEDQTRIFERFYRVEKSRSQRNGGTGLGLSIVKHICALYGWKVSLRSKPGIGTEVTVVFGR